MWECRGVSMVCSIFFGGIYSQHGASLLDRKDEESFFFSLPIIRTPLKEDS